MTMTCCCGCGQKTSPQGYYIAKHAYLGKVLPLAERLASKIDQGGASDCWPWTGARNSFGYGVLGERGEQLRAHRVAYEIANGPIPDGMVVRHACDNPPCCNPAHLSVGTNADNVDDMVSRKRHQFGERAYQHILTEDDVRAARTAWQSGASSLELSQKYGLSHSAMRHALTGLTWRHVKDAAS